jgi:hypothetical protein
MASNQPQTYATHRRYDPSWHFVGFMILLLGVIAASVHAYRQRTYYNHWMIIYTFGVLLVTFRARAQTVTVQNRVIRLEMRLRLKDVLPAALIGRIDELQLSQLIGLRFAPDAELAGLVERCLSGELANGEVVKKQIKNWVPDYVRA